MKPPCGKNCPDRHVGCQGKCEHYLAFRAELAERKPNNYADCDYRRYVSGVKARIALKRMPNTRRNRKKER